MNCSPHALRFLSLTVVLLSAMTGCGGGVDDPFQRTDVTGVVNFEGKPLQYGEIVLRAEASKVGDELPQATLPIRDGKFESNPAAQPGEGQNKVVVAVFDGAAPPPADPNDESGASPPDPKVVGYYQTDVTVKAGEPLQIEIKKADLAKQYPE